MNNLVKSSFASVSFLAMMASSLPAFAQEQESNVDQTGDVDEKNVIVVTAQFREQRLQDVPLAITAVNAEMLDARGQTDISQVAAQAPNVTLRSQPQSGGIGLIAFIRGVGQTDFNYALEPGVGIYVDDVYIPTLSSSLLDLMDLDRIEVLRGPQGTLAGKNSIGGAIKLFSQKPTGSGEGSIQATYGSYNRIDVRGMADIKLAENLFARVSGATKSADGYVTLLDYGLTHPNSNVPASNNQGKGGKQGELGGRFYAAGKLALRWLPTDTIEVNISGDYTREKNDAGAQVLLSANASGTTPDGIAFLTGNDGNPVPYDSRFVPVTTRYGVSTDTPPSGYDPRFINYANFLDGRTPTSQAPYKPYAATNQQTFKGWGLMGNVTAELTDNLQAVWISSFRKYEMNFGFDQDGSPVPVSQLDNQLEHQAWSQELRLNGELGDGLVDFTVGGFYFDQDGNYQARVDLNYAGIDFIHGPDTTPSTSKAIFLNTTLHVTDALNLTGGIRQSWDKKDYTYFRSNPDGTVPFVDVPPPPGLPPVCEFFLGAPTAGPVGIGNTPNCLLTGLFDVTDSFKGNRTDWRVVADYRFSPEFLAYASVSTGYKGGGVNPRPFFGPSAGECADLPPGVIAPCNQLKPFNPETITTYELGFKSDLFDRNLRINGAVFFNKYNDIILTLTACPGAPCLQPANVGKADVKGFELEVNASPIEGFMFDGSLSYIDLEYKDTGTSGVPLTNTTPYTPKWNASFGAQYDHQLASGVLGLRFDGSYQSSIFTQAFNAPSNKVDGRFLGNARLSYTTDDGDWQASFEVQNVFDKYYFHTVEDLSGIAGFGAITAAPGLPRTWALTVKRNF